MNNRVPILLSEPLSVQVGECKNGLDNGACLLTVMGHLLMVHVFELHLVSLTRFRNMLSQGAVNEHIESHYISSRINVILI